jgi:uridine kinase
VAVIARAAERVRPGTRPVFVALDGRSGVGKSSLAGPLAQQVAGRVIRTDDFWTGGSQAVWAMRSPEQRVAHAIDWRRLREQVLEPLRTGHRASWPPFDWQRGEGLSEVSLTCDPAPVIVLDGAYSARPELADVVDVTVLVTLDDVVRRRRLLMREGAPFMRAWHALWDPAEDFYFARVRPAESFDLVVAGP